MSALIQHNDHDQTEPFMAFVMDDITSRSLSEIVKGQGWNENRIFEGGIDFALQTLSDISTPELLIIDLSGCDDPLARISDLAAVCDPGVRLVCLGTFNDVQLYRDLLEMGVEDYLLKPIDPDTLSHALERAQETVTVEQQQEPECEGDVVSVVGALGGVGTSSIALNLAWSVSQNASRKVALVDLDLHFGTLALSMDLEPGKGFREALENPNRIDSLFLDRAMVKVNDTLSLLACETDIDVTCQFDSEALGLLIERLRQKFDLVVLDVTRSLLPQCGDMLSKLGKVVVVTDLSLAGMRDTLRISRFAKNHMIEDNLVLMANRAGENKERELAPKEFEKGVDHDLNTIVPFDAKGFGQAEMQGCALMKAASKSKAAAAMQSVFSMFDDMDDEDKTKPSLWRKLVGKT